jgi:endonuclease/exonuclease/phosphatase (EEP) superfamily protein YafD
MKGSPCRALADRVTGMVSLRDFFSLKLRPWEMLTAAGSLAAAATIAGFFDRFGWAFDLATHFRVQYAVVLLLIGAAFLAGRRYRHAAVFLLLGFVNAALVLPMFFGQTPPAPSGAVRLRAMLLNVHTANTQYARVLEVIDEFSPDILMLEELDDKWVAGLAGLKTTYPHSRASVREDNFGIALFSRLPFERPSILYLGSAGVPSVVAQIEVNGARFAVLGTHPLPPGSPEYIALRNEQLDSIADFSVKMNTPLVVLGDLNVTPWSYHFQRLLQRSGLRDSARGRGIQPTWPSDAKVLLIPIDHCLFSKGIVVLNRQAGPDVGSDHYPLIVDFAVTKE